MIPVTFFEMVAQERLIMGFKPALRHLLGVFSRANPRLSFLGQCSNEAFALIMYNLHKHYLKLYDSTFTENFFGLKRVRATLEKEKALRTVDRRRALFCLVVGPYIKSRLDQWYDRRLEEQQVLQQAGQEPEREPGFRGWLFRNYPKLHACFETVRFLFQLGFLFELSGYYSPSFWLVGQKVERLTMKDVMRHQRAQQQRQLASRTTTARVDLNDLWKKGERSWPAALAKRLGSSFARIQRFFASYAKYGLLIGIFAFKFFEWWYSPDNQLQHGRRLPIPPPPPPAPPRTTIQLPVDDTLCPLCKRHRTNPACSSSGYVFCYPCLFHALTADPRCPITLQPCTTDQIRKIFEN